MVSKKKIFTVDKAEFFADLINPKLALISANKIDREYNHEYSLKPINITMAILCLDRSLPSKWWRKIQCLTMVIANLTATIYTARERFLFYSEISTVTGIIDMLAFCHLCFAKSILCIAGGFLTHGRYKNNAKKFIKIDSLLNIQNYSFYRSIRLRALSLVILTIFLCISVQIYDFFTWYTNLNFHHGLLNIPLYYNSTVLIFAILNFIFPCWMVWMRLVIINCHLTKHYPSLQDSYESRDSVGRKVANLFYGLNWIEEEAADSVKFRPKNIDHLVEAYKILCDLADMLNDAFSIQNVVISLNGILYIVRALRMALLYADVNPENLLSGLIHPLLTSVNTSVCCMILVILMCSHCEYIVDETHKTAILLNKLLLEDGLENNYKIKAWARLVRILKPRFTGCGLYNIDYTLLFSIAVAIATYLIIVIQN